MVPVLQISPIDSFIDEDVSITVTGCQPIEYTNVLN
ncbi:hypothetical protein J2S19_001391 [Metabacillus malikii]|uniref:Uncharacterized protein n=1 Tax=Metabacillus malikii TaxID=1504265 RepID=A0ABT9ZD00_9BACI|nr:hypothetical protein [Metabacillus malikii]